MIINTYSTYRSSAILIQVPNAVNVLSTACNKRRPAGHAAQHQLTSTHDGLLHEEQLLLHASLHRQHTVWPPALLRSTCAGFGGPAQLPLSLSMDLWRNSNPLAAASSINPTLAVSTHSQCGMHQLMVHHCVTLVHADKRLPDILRQGAVHCSVLYRARRNPVCPQMKQATASSSSPSSPPLS
jgi:hypothetical protein